MSDETPEFEFAAREMNRYLLDAVNQIQELKELRTDAFIKADLYMREVATRLKGREQVPRQVLQKLRMAAGVLENEAPYAKDEASVLQMANDVQTTLDLILWGECHDDRKPGIPRVR